MEASELMPEVIPAGPADENTVGSISEPFEEEKDHAAYYKQLVHDAGTVSSEADTSCTLSVSSSIHSDSEEDERQKDSIPDEFQNTVITDDEYTKERNSRLLTDIADLEIYQSTRKEVRFDLDLIQVRDDPQILTNRERSAYWYTNMDIQSFQIDRQVSAKNTLKTKNKSLMAFMMASSQQQQSAQELLENLHSKCCSVASDDHNVINSDDVADLRNLYKRTSELPGLEHLCVTPKRGTSSAIVRSVLDEYIYAKDFDNEERDALANISSSMTRPSRVLAYLLAAAQASAIS